MERVLYQETTRDAYEYSRLGGRIAYGRQRTVHCVTYPKRDANYTVHRAKNCQGRNRRALPTTASHDSQRTSSRGKLNCYDDPFPVQEATDHVAYPLQPAIFCRS